MPQRERVLVVGGAGYIGSFTVRELADACDVTVLDDLSAGHAAAVDTRATFVKGSVADQSVLHELFRSRFDAVVHFAALTSVPESMTRPLEYYLANVGNTLSLLHAMAAHDVRRIVFSSTAAVYGIPQAALTETHPLRPVNPYGETKLTVERLLQSLAPAGRLDAVALRYFNACGAADDGSLGEDHRPEPHLIPIVLRAGMAGEPVTIFGRDYETSDGTCVRDFIHVEDLASAHAAALRATRADSASFRAYNVGTGTGASVREILAAAERVLDKEIRRVFAERRPGDPPVLVADSERIRRELEWAPRHTSLTEILRAVHLWMQKNPHGYAS